MPPFIFGYVHLAGKERVYPATRRLFSDQTDQLFGGKFVMLSEHFHGSVQLYSLLGIVPSKDKTLMNGLGYRFLHLNRKRSPEIASVLDALEQHLPDYAYGSPENIHRWEQLHRKGRVRKT